MVRLVSIVALLGTLFVLTVIPLPFQAEAQVQRLFHGVAPGVRLEGRPVSGFTESEIEGLLGFMEERDHIEPVNASLDPGTGEVLPDIPGRCLDVPTTLDLVMNAGPGNDVLPVYQALEAEWTAGVLGALTEVLGDYATWVGGTSARLGNVRLASQIISNTLLFPGQVFSFNGTVGVPSPERGFMKAPVIVEDELVMGVGGGVCQVSSTLYNAALEAKMVVIERHPHSKPVQYVPEGRDATVAYDYKDLKFENPGPYPVIIKVQLSDRHLRAVILGSQ